MKNSGINGKTIVVTGASTGIGKAIAMLFLEQGNNVVLNSSNKENLTKTFDEFDCPDRIAMVIADVSHPETGQKLVDAALDKFGSLDVLINNAGIFAPKPFMEVDETDLDKYLSINLKGTYFVTQAVIREMLKTDKGGSVINIGTVLVDHAIAGFPATAPLTSKGAIHALTRQLAAEFGQNNIRINTIAPGVIRSPLQGKIGLDNADGLADLHLLKRVGEVDDIASVAYQLASANFITGETINVDGGHVAGHQFA